MPEVRLLGDPTPEQLPQDDQRYLDEANERIEQAASAPPDMEGMEDAGEVEQAYQLWLQDGLRQFETLVCNHIEIEQRGMVSARQEQDVDGRYVRENEKFRNRQAPKVDMLGQIIEGSQDEHLKAGLTLGLFIDNCNTISPAMAEQLLGRGKAPFELKPKGRKAENDAKKRVLTAIVLDQLEKSGWRAEMDSGIRDLPRHGTCILRGQWIELTEWRITAEGVLEQIPVHRGAWFRHWPMLNVFVSDPECKRARDQRSVIWYSQTTIGELLREERLLQVGEQVTVGDAGDVVVKPLIVEHGRFFNLERLLRPELERGDRTPIEHGRDANSPEGTDPENNRITHHSRLELFERQGEFPLGQYVREGVIGPEHLLYYGVKIMDRNGMLTGERLARVLDRLFWYISVVKSENDEQGPTLIELRPCPYPRARNEMFHGTFIPDGQRFYGRSSDAIAEDISDSADKVLNDIVDILDNNADPPRMVDRSGFETDEQAEQACNKPGSVAVLRGGNGVAPTDRVGYLLKPYDASFMNLMQALVETYNTRTLANALQKGGQATTESDTYAEARTQLQEAERRLQDVIRRLAEDQLVVPAIEFIIDCLEWFLAPEELGELAREIGGELGLSAETIFPTGDDEDNASAKPLREEFTIQSAAAVNIEREVAIQFLLKLGAEARDMPELNRQLTYIDAMDLAGLDGEKYFRDPMRMLSPRQELEMIMAGDRPEVNPLEDAIGTHLPTHQAQLQMLAVQRGQMEAQGQPTDAVDGWLAVLQEHLMATVDLAQQQMLMLMQAAAQAEAGGEQGTPGKDGGSPGSTKRPPGQQAIAGGIQQGAVQTPPGGDQI